LKLQLKQHSQRMAYSEVVALRRTFHPFIVRLERAFQTPKFFALLLELCPTDLNRVLCMEDDDGRCLGLPPERAAKYMGQVLLALKHLHLNDGIVYRDMKPENILISHLDEAKLTDFGLAKVVNSAERMTMCGTRGFVPPELLKASADTNYMDALDAFKLDAYSFGITLQVTLLGVDGAELREVRRKGPMMFPAELEEHDNRDILDHMLKEGRLSPAAHALLVDLLRHDPLFRKALADDETANHAFFCDALGCTDLAKHLLLNH